MAFSTSAGPRLPLELLEEIFRIAKHQADVRRDLDSLVLSCMFARKTIKRPTDAQLLTHQQIWRLSRLAVSFESVIPYAQSGLTFADLDLIEVLVPTTKAGQSACMKIFKNVKIRELNILMSWTSALKDLEVLRVKYEWYPVSDDDSDNSRSNSGNSDNSDDNGHNSDNNNQYSDDCSDDDDSDSEDNADEQGSDSDTRVQVPDDSPWKGPSWSLCVQELTRLQMVSINTPLPLYRNLSERHCPWIETWATNHPTLATIYLNHSYDDSIEERLDPNWQGCTVYCRRTLAEGDCSATWRVGPWRPHDDEGQYSVLGHTRFFNTSISYLKTSNTVFK
ncbi:hypothetical protein NLJ89_g12040 [Agrocybe chaxingu]|uniref:Uncharacterized protein n=1 Tax=Agrocybe chaxingu TaxID=84603 RepID=A0A9W8MQL7_9AGAR|nr:hypothetical protein NLJ89_g12040 [Agrocybe chaxingu]